MKTIKINHWRCDEPSAYTFVLCPEEWTSEEINNKLVKAQKEYLGAIEEANKAIEPEKVHYHGTYTDLMKIGKENPDLTFAEVNQIWEDQKEAYNEWYKKQQMLTQSFTRFLIAQGFRHLYALDEDLEFELYWGHRHGERLDYEDTKVDTMVKPRDYNEKEEKSE